MAHYVLTYEFVDRFVERRAPLREAHLRLLHDAHAKGLLVSSGPLGDPPDGALLICSAESAAAVEDLARADPYVTGGLVTGWHVRPWKVLVGAQPAAASPA